ncbi:hypothetical protein CcCBS67573_g03990 [Chytriomyces confervae]|uniref:BHLH domain-containing protein n=1 Tax=Chytriomyces confervae TaxID=246404 RepID=A0A507FF12_9FUNG|nr:hypothetical protein HDU80_011217 [Chytriomyces hyalinus]TPX74722.1 hypothetical protein CcCBS67573_g03990 [Chytriomyces confervae]
MEHGSNYAYLKVAAGKEASPGVDLFDFFELFGDNDGDERDEQLLTGDDQAMFAQFLDAFDAGNSGGAGGGAPGGLSGMGGITPSLDLFGNCVGASDLLGMANASFAKYSNGGGSANPNNNSAANNTMPTGSAVHSGNGLMAEDSLTIPVSIPMHHVETPSALFPLHQAQHHHHPINHHTNHPMALHVLNSNGNAKNSSSNGDGVDEYLSQSLPKRMKSSSNTNANANAPASFGFIPFFQQQQQQHQQQHHQLHQMQQQQMHHQQNQQQQQQQQPQQQSQQQHLHPQIHHSSNDFMSFAPKLDPYTNNMMPPIASYQPQLGSSTRLPTPSPPLATQVLHSTSSLVSSTSTSALSTAISAANHHQGSTLTMPVSIPKKRGRKPKEVPAAAASASTSNDTKSAASTGGGAANTGTTTASSSGSTPALFPSTKSSKPLLTPSEKKANHIQAEQRRRAQIRDALKELSQIVPGLLPPIDGELTVEGSSRVEILEGTKRYVETLRENNDRLRRQLLET